MSSTGFNMTCRDVLVSTAKSLVHGGFALLTDMLSGRQQLGPTWYMCFRLATSASNASSLRQCCLCVQEEPQGLSSNSLREYSDPSLHYSRQPAYSSTTNNAYPLHPTPATTAQQAGGRRAVEEGSSGQTHSRQQDSGKSTRFQGETLTGESFCATSMSVPKGPPRPPLPPSTHTTPQPCLPLSTSPSK